MSIYKEIKVRVTKWEKDSVKGFATVEVVFDEESTMRLNGITLREFKGKDGELKIAPFLASKKKEDGKYEEYTSVRGPFWWDISNAIMAEYNGTSVPKKAEENTPEENIALAKNPATATKTPYTTPFRPR